jgi:hypothetical protein
VIRHAHHDDHQLDEEADPVVRPAGRPAILREVADGLHQL